MSLGIYSIVVFGEQNTGQAPTTSFHTTISQFYWKIAKGGWLVKHP